MKSMQLKQITLRQLIIITGSFLIFFTFSSCSKFPKGGDARNVPVNAQERARKNIEEGRGVSIKNLGKSLKGSGSYEFSTSNPMWRASLDILDFLPLANIDYSGGVIITDWYSDKNNKSEQLKITLRFLSNEIRSDSLKIIIHQRTCAKNNACSIILLKNSRINTELVVAIVKKAAIIEKELKKK